RLMFFFSSRRRHTRSKRDWSSDVCSSDLLSTVLSTVLLSANRQNCSGRRKPMYGWCSVTRSPSSRGYFIIICWSYARAACSASRSEERRVGKEGRSHVWRETCTRREE